MKKNIRINNYNFNYRSLGNSINFPILFLHGFMGDCDDFNESMALLSNDFYCLAVDLPGHGNTKVIGEEKYYQIEYISYGLIRFLDALRINKCALVGYSMGGRVALYLALYFPKYFSQVILESASPGLKTQEERDRRIESDLNLIKELETEDFLSFITKWYNQPLFSSIKEHPDFQLILKRRLQNNPGELSKSLCHLSTGCQPSLWTKLQENSISLLLLVGELDKKFVDINTEMVNLCKLAQLEIVGSCGHNIHVEDVNSFVEKIRHFLTTDLG